MKKRKLTLRSNRRLAQRTWGDLSPTLLQGLRELTGKYDLSVAMGDLHQIGGQWYVTHAGLLRTAQRKHCLGIQTCVQRAVSDPAASRWVFKATVYKDSRSKGFVGYGDADPSNTSPLVRGAEMRVAETRAVNRALRKAYGIGLCSVEELVLFQPHRSLSLLVPFRTVMLDQMVQAMVGHACGTDFACSFASTILIHH
jgi:hypothetical protein